MLQSTIFENTSLDDVDLSYADLTSANFSFCSLVSANLSHAILAQTVFNDTSLYQANFSYATTSLTTFGDVNLRYTIGLDTIIHYGLSNISTNALQLSEGNIPTSFLRGAGLSDSFIEYVRSLTTRTIEYYSCFISYSNQDESFVRRLYADLQNHNVRCWFAPEDLKIGDKFRHRIDESIRIHDKLLLVLSEASIASTWVGYEVEKALDKEPEGKPNVLFPIRLDKEILTCETDWAKDIRNSRHIGDFENWKDHDAYQVAFKRLLRDLKAQS